MARRRLPPLLLAAAALLLLLLRPRGAGAPMLTTEAYGFEMPWERVSGSVEACCASVEDVQRDHERTDALLRSIVERPFFRIFKVNLERPCQFFPDDGTCGRESCAVAECCEEEVPAPWRSGSAPRTCSAKPQRSAAPSCAAGENDVDFTLLTSFHGFDTWDGPDVSIVQGSAPDAWAAGLPLRGGLAPLNASSSGSGGERELSSRDGAMSYVNLQQNPEKYTGYVGETATRIWAAICKPRYFFIDLVIALLAADVSRLTRERSRESRRGELLRGAGRRRALLRAARLLPAHERPAHLDQHSPQPPLLPERLAQPAPLAAQGWHASGIHAPAASL